MFEAMNETLSNLVQFLLENKEKLTKKITLTELDLQRFWSKVDKTPGYGPKGDCWEWTAHTIKGYGHFRLGRKHMQSHVVSWILIHKRNPVYFILHKCNNPRCVNPMHLYEGTHTINMQDRKRAGKYGLNKGEKQGNAKLTEQQVLEIREIYKQDPATNQTLLCKKYGVCKNTISSILIRRTWKHI